MWRSTPISNDDFGAVTCRWLQTLRWGPVADGMGILKSNREMPLLLPANALEFSPLGRYSSLIVWGLHAEYFSTDTGIQARVTPC